MTDMGRKNWSDPEVAKPMLDKIPLGKFAGNHNYSCMFIMSIYNYMIIPPILFYDIFMLNFNFRA